MIGKENIQRMPSFQIMFKQNNFINLQVTGNILSRKMQDNFILKKEKNSIKYIFIFLIIFSIIV